MFYEELSLRESTKNQYAVNKYGYLGLYQMGKLALIDVGYIKNNQWTGKYNIYSSCDFLNSRWVQEVSVREYHKLIWDKYLTKYHHYQDKYICGVKICKASMIAASHLVGHVYLKKFLNTQGNKNAKDANHVSCLDYLKYFENYEINYDLNNIL